MKVKQLNMVYSISKEIILRFEIMEIYSDVSDTKDSLSGFLSRIRKL